MPSSDRRDYWVEIASQILNGLFTITGIGLIPWRARDTYRMGVIWTIANRVWRRRKARGLEPLDKRDDLPQHGTKISETEKNHKGNFKTVPDIDLEANRKVHAVPAKHGTVEYRDSETMLTDKEEAQLLHQQVCRISVKQLLQKFMFKTVGVSKGSELVSSPRNRYSQSK